MTHTNSPILIVDDDEDIRELMKVFLEAEGYHVNVAADGLDALKQIEAGLRPALILLDLMMPRMDGEQFLKKLRASEDARTPVLILSGNASAPDRALALNENCCLMKPIELDDLLNAVRRFMRRDSQQDAA